MDEKIKKMIEAGMFAEYSKIAAHDIGSGDFDCRTACLAMTRDGLTQDQIDMFLLGVQLGIVNAYEEMTATIDKRDYSLEMANPGHLSIN